MDRFEIRLSGAGGQGVITTGIMLAEAAVGQGLNAVQTQAYGPEARGGASRAEVVISGAGIDYPKVECPDIVLTLSQQAYELYGRSAPEGALVVYDSDLVHPGAADGPATRRGLPLTALARQATGRAVTASTLAAAVVGALSGVLTRDALRQAVRSNVPQGTVDMNLKALEEGFRAAEALGGLTGRAAPARGSTTRRGEG